jgi:hypothetical protein
LYKGVGVIRDKLGIYGLVGTALVTYKTVWFSPLLMIFLIGPNKKWIQIWKHRLALQLVESIEDPAKRDAARENLAYSLIHSSSQETNQTE